MNEAGDGYSCMIVERGEGWTTVMMHLSAVAVQLDPARKVATQTVKLSVASVGSIHALATLDSALRLS
jgi:hypothetical protein